MAAGTAYDFSSYSFGMNPPLPLPFHVTPASRTKRLSGACETLMHRLSRLSLMLASLPAILPVSADPLTWDTVVDGTLLTHGSGTWDLAGLRWNNGAGVNVAWTNSPVKDASFVGGASGATITLGSDPIVAGTITVNGTGNTILQGPLANLSAGTLEVSTFFDGKLVMNSASSGTLSQIPAITIAEGSTLYLSSGVIVASTITVTGPGNNENRGALRLDNDAKLQGAIHLTGDATFGSSFGTGLFSSTVSGPFAFNQAATSPGIVRLTGDNQHTGGTRLLNGVVQAGHDHAFGSGTLNVGNLTLSSDSATARSFANASILSGTAVVLGNATNSGKLTFQGPASTGTTNRTITANSDVEFSALASGGQVTKAGSGKMILNGSLTASTASAVLAGSPVTLGESGATIDTNGFDIGIPVAFEGTGGFKKIGSGTLSLSGSSTFTGPVTVAAGSLRLQPSTVLPAGLKILPIGDSITFGYGGRDGYRSYLYTKLARNAPGFRFLGDSTEVPLNPSGLPAEHLFHAGHSSYSTTDIKNNLNGLDSTTFQTYGGAERNPHGGYWLTGGHGTGRAAIFPDAVLLLAGTNDVDRLEMAGAQTRYRALLTEITTLRPEARVFAAKITPWSANASKVTQFNQVITNLVTEFRNAGRKVTLVDLHTGYTGGFVDGVHPAEAGYQWMADQWHAALVSALGTPTTPDLSHASSVTVMNGAAIEGSGKLAAAVISGTLRSAITASGSDWLEISGDLDLDQATLAITAPAQPAQPSYEIIRYTGNLSGDFATISGLPAGFQVTHVAGTKKIYLATAFEAWRLQSGIPDASKSPEADPDQDGRSNLLEYALGGLPLDPTDRGTLIENLDLTGGGTRLGLLIATLAGASFSAGPDHGLVASVAGTSYQVEASSDLTAWDHSVSEVLPLPAGLPPLPKGYEYHAFTTGDGERAFARVKLSQAP